MNLQIYISQGSNHFITNFPRNVPVKTFWKFDEDVEKFAAYFLAHTVYAIIFANYFCLTTIVRITNKIDSDFIFVFCHNTVFSTSKDLPSNNYAVNVIKIIKLD